MRKAYQPKVDPWGKKSPQWYRQAKWRKLRAAVLQVEPLCRICDANGVARPATVVDHVQPVSKGGAKYDQRNLQPLCDKCHNTKSSSERVSRGG